MNEELFDVNGMFTRPRQYREKAERSSLYGPAMAYSKTDQLPRPHYSESYWREARTIYGKAAKKLEYVYSDRLVQWDYEKSRQSAGGASKDHQPNTVAWVEAYLSLYYDQPVEVRHIQGGVNLSNGYEYYCYGFERKEKA